MIINIKYFMKISIFLNFFQLLSSENVNSFSKIYDSDGNGKFHKTGAFHKKFFRTIKLDFEASRVEHS